MYLTPREQEKLLIVVAADLARRRQARGLKLNHPEAMAIITYELLEGARDGLTVAELMSAGTHILYEDDVMPGVAGLIEELSVEATFPDGTKLITVHHPIRPRFDAEQSTSTDKPARNPGEILPASGEIILNEDQPVVPVRVQNTGDRPIQVGSHYHFFEANRALLFDRAATYGMRLDIASGTAVRFEPGETRTVSLVPLGGDRVIVGLNALTDGSLDDPEVRTRAIERVLAQGFLSDNRSTQTSDAISDTIKEVS